MEYSEFWLLFENLPMKLAEWTKTQGFENVYVLRKKRRD